MSVRTSKRIRHAVAMAATALVAALVLGAFASTASAAPTIRFKGNGLDRFKFHGRVKLDPPSIGGPVDPLTSGFGVEILNELGVVYSASLVPGDLEARPNLYYEFKDRDARYGNGTHGGLYQVITRFREYSDGWYYTVRILAYTDLSSATEPRMTVIFNEVGGSAAVTAEWQPKSYGWRLPLSRF